METQWTHRGSRHVSPTSRWDKSELELGPTRRHRAAQRSMGRFPLRAFAVAVALAAGLSACSKGGDSASPLPPTAEGLAGTTWRFETVTITFKTPPDLLIRDKERGNVDLPGTFTVVDDGHAARMGARIIEVTVMDMTRAGLWDGSRLIIDGAAGVRQ